MAGVDVSEYIECNVLCCKSPMDDLCILRFVFQVKEMQRSIHQNRTSLAGLRCLIVDDSKTNRTIVHHYITSWGMGNGSAANGGRGLEFLRRAAAEGHPYDLAIIDMQMPEMDGLQLARMIKSEPGIAGTRLILLTSMGNQNAPMMKQAGFSAGLAKPVRQSQLFDCIANVMADTLTAVETSGNANSVHPSSLKLNVAPVSKAGAKPRKRLRILVAEDNAVNQTVAVRMLEKLGYRVDVAANGVEAVHALSLIPYDIVFMDCQMPEMDGFEATTKIRTVDGSRRHTTIVAMTANALQGDKEKYLEAGMDDYISKPIQQTDLAAAIDRCASQSQAIENDSPTVNASHALVDQAVLDELGELANEDDPNIVEQLLGMFTHETPGRIEHIRRGASNQDARDVSQMVHLLKGTCTQLGLAGMVKLCQTLENRANANDMHDIEIVIAELGQIFHDTKEVLQSKYSLREV